MQKATFSCNRYVIPPKGGSVGVHFNMKKRKVNSLETLLPREQKGQAHPQVAISSTGLIALALMGTPDCIERAGFITGWQPNIHQPGEGLGKGTLWLGIHCWGQLEFPMQFRGPKGKWTL